MIDFDATRVAQEALSELSKARKSFGPLASPHEGYAVLLEEVEELWEEVRANKGDPAEYLANCRKEAIQVAAMAIAFIGEVCDK
jgi:hypothetical protein